MKVILVCIVFLLNATLAVADLGKHLFILSGQSNMAALDPSISFIPAISREFGSDNFIVIKDAHGGQSIRRWYEYGDLYQTLMNKMDYVLEYENIETVSLIWMQGEQDTEYPDDYINYSNHLNALLNQLRADIGGFKLHYVIGRLSPYKNGEPGWDKVRSVQVEVAESNMLGVWVDTDDIDRKRIHYTELGYRQLGHRFAMRAIQLIKNNK